MSPSSDHLICDTNQHGSCNEETSKCECTDSWWGVDCSHGCAPVTNLTTQQGRFSSDEASTNGIYPYVEYAACTWEIRPEPGTWDKIRITADVCNLGLADLLTIYELNPADGTRSSNSLLAINEQCIGGETAEFSVRALSIEFVADYEAGGKGFVLTYVTVTSPNYTAVIVGVVVPVGALFIAVFVVLIILWRRSINKVRDLQLRLGMMETDVTGTPAEGAVKSLLEIRKKHWLRAKDQEELLRIIGLISSNKLFKMELRKKLNKNMDSDVNEFLFNTLSQDSSGTPRAPELLRKSRECMVATTLDASTKSPSSYFRDTDFILALSKWNDFDVVQLNSLHGSPLSRVADLLFDATDLCQTLSLDRHKVSSFVKKLQAGYRDNPYHSALHAADVSQALYSLIVASGFSFTSIELLAALLAAMSHDFKHPGRTSAFLINTKDPLAIRYNHISVLESMHASESASLLLEEDSNFLSHLDRETWLEFHRIFTSLILSTDMSKHGEILGQLSVKMAAGSMDQNNKADRLLVLDLLMKVADLSNASRRWDLCQYWTDSVTAEFFMYVHSHFSYPPSCSFIHSLIQTGKEMMKKVMTFQSLHSWIAQLQMFPNVK